MNGSPVGWPGPVAACAAAKIALANEGLKTPTGSDSAPGGCHGRGAGAAVGRNRADQGGPRNHRRRGGQLQRRACRGAPWHKATVGQHHAVAQRGQLEGLPAAVGVAGHADPRRVRDALVDQAPDQLLRVARLVARVGEMDVAGRAVGGVGQARLGHAAGAPLAASGEGQHRVAGLGPVVDVVGVGLSTLGRGTRTWSCRSRGPRRPAAGRCRHRPATRRSCRAAPRPRC